MLQVLKMQPNVHTFTLLYYDLEVQVSSCIEVFLSFHDRTVFMIFFSSVAVLEALSTNILSDCQSIGIFKFWCFSSVAEHFSPSLCRSRLTPTPARTARSVSWPGKVTASGCPSGWTPPWGCSTPTPCSTCRMSTLSPTSARCLVGLQHNATLILIPKFWKAQWETVKG